MINSGNVYKLIGLIILFKWRMRIHDENTIEIKSPCNGDCFIDNSNKLCQGCFRTMNEIISWCSMDDKEKEELMEKVEMRRKQYESK